MNWYDSDTEYPIYAVSTRGNPDEEIEAKINAFTPKDSLYQDNGYLCYDPNPEDFDLHRDFEKLIYAFVECISV